MAKFEFAEWLLLWLNENRRFEFDWDDGNRAKNAAKHSVRTGEAEDVFTLGRAAPLGIQVSPATAEERWGVVGTTSEGRILHVVFTLRDGKVRPISARPAHKKEREIHEAYVREI